MTLIIIEGIDGSGKTTVAKALSAREGIPYVNLFAGAESWLGLGSGFTSQYGREDYAEDFAVADFCRQTGASAIQDRGALSAVVYRDAHGGRLGMTYRQWVDAWLKLAPDDTMVVLVERALHQCILARPERYAAVDGKSADQRVAERLRDLFRTHAQSIPHHTIAVENEEGNLDGTVVAIEMELRRWRELVE